MAYFLRKLKAFDSEIPLPLEEREVGSYTIPFEIDGNSILSTVFVESLDPGASVKVWYTDSTTGIDVGEEYFLAAHPEMFAFGNTRLTVTRIHNKPRLNVEVIGGKVKFSVYITVVDSFASDLDQALQVDQETVVFDRDKGMPIMAVTLDGKFVFLRTEGDGTLSINSPGSKGDLQSILGSANNVAANIETSIISLVSTGSELFKIEVDSENVSTFRVYINGVLNAEKGTYYASPLNTEFCYSGGSKGVLIPAGAEILVTGVHKNPSACRMTARILLNVLPLV
jgi:hypothetical protein